MQTSARGPVGAPGPRRGRQTKGQDPLLLVSGFRVSGLDPRTLCVFSREMSSRTSPFYFCSNGDHTRLRPREGQVTERQGSERGRTGPSPIHPNESKPFRLDLNHFFSI